MFKFIKSIFDSETMGEEIVAANVRTYNDAKRMHPDGSKFDWLVATYLGRLQARGALTENSGFDAEYQCSKLVEIPEPHNARALGLIILHQERVDIVRSNQKFTHELEGIASTYGAEL